MIAHQAAQFIVDEIATGNGVVGDRTYSDVLLSAPNSCRWLPRSFQVIPHSACDGQATRAFPAAHRSIRLLTSLILSSKPARVTAY